MAMMLRLLLTVSGCFTAAMCNPDLKGFDQFNFNLLGDLKASLDGALGGYRLGEQIKSGHFSTESIQKEVRREMRHSLRAHNLPADMLPSWRGSTAKFLEDMSKRLDLHVKNNVENIAVSAEIGVVLLHARGLSKAYAEIQSLNVDVDSLGKMVKMIVRHYFSDQTAFQALDNAETRQRCREDIDDALDSLSKIRKAANAASLTTKVNTLLGIAGTVLGGAMLTLAAGPAAIVGGIGGISSLAMTVWDVFDFSRVDVIHKLLDVYEQVLTEAQVVVRRLDMGQLLSKYDFDRMTKLAERAMASASVWCHKQDGPENVRCEQFCVRSR